MYKTSGKNLYASLKYQKKIHTGGIFMFTR